MQEQCAGAGKATLPLLSAPAPNVKHPKRLIRSPGSTFSSIPVKYAGIAVCHHGACIHPVEYPEKCAVFVGYCSKVSQWCVPFSAFPRKELSPEICLPDIRADSLGTKFEMQATSLEEERNEGN